MITVNTTAATTRPAASPSPWLTCVRPNPRARLRLFCFPYAGGSSMIFRNWADALPASVEVCALRLPGRESRLRETAYTSLPPLTRAIDEALAPYLDKPFAFFGHSMGAIISYDYARLLRDTRGTGPAHLFVSGRRAPHLSDSTDSGTYALPEPEFIEELRRLNGTPKEVLEHPELMQMMIPLLRADFSVCQTYSYTPAPPLDCPITAFGGLGDEGVPRESVEGWREHTTSTFTARMLQGDHFFINSSQALLLRALSVELSRLA